MMNGEKGHVRRPEKQATDGEREELATDEEKENQPQMDADERR